MGEFQPLHWLVVIGMLGLVFFISGYPLATLCRRTGKSPAVAWLACTIGLFVCGPTLCLWWLAFSKWKVPPTKTP